MDPFETYALDARDFARFEHSIRNHRYGPHEYVFHLDATVRVLERFGIHDQALIAAGYLHDVLEDCEEVTREQIEDLFGLRVGALVWAVTDEPGRNRKERKARTYPKIAATPGAVTIKLADRIANAEYSAFKDQARYKMYQKEQSEFEAALLDPHDIFNMKLWNHLESILADKQYASVKEEDDGLS